MSDNESRYMPVVDKIFRRHMRAGRRVYRSLFRGFCQRGRPYMPGIGTLSDQESISGGIIWSRLDGYGRLHWMVQPLASEYAGVQRDD